MDPNSYSKSIKRYLDRLMEKKLTIRFFNPQYLGNVFLNRALKEHSKSAYGIILDIGCGESPYRELFQHDRVSAYYTIDYPAYTEKYFAENAKKVDVFSDLQNIPIRPYSVDCVLLT